MSNHEVVNQWLDPEEVRALAEGLLVPVPGTDFTPDESFFGDSFEGFTDRAPEPAKKEVEVQKERESPLVVPELKREAVAAPPSPPTPERPVQADPFRKVSKITTAGADDDPAKAARKIESLPTSPSQPPREIKTEATPSPFRPALQRPVTPAAAKPTSPADALEPFIKWLKKQNQIQASFICEQGGKVMFDEVGNAKLRKVGRALALAAKPPGLSVGNDPLKSFTRVRVGEGRFMEILPLDSPNGLLIVGLIVERPLSGPALEIVSRTFLASFERASPAGQRVAEEARGREEEEDGQGDEEAPAVPLRAY